MLLTESDIVIVQQVPQVSLHLLWFSWPSGYHLVFIRQIPPIPKLKTWTRTGQKQTWGTLSGDRNQRNTMMDTNKLSACTQEREENRKQTIAVQGSHRPPAEVPFTFLLNALSCATAVVDFRDLEYLEIHEAYSQKEFIQKQRGLPHGQWCRFHPPLQLF